MKTDIKIQEDVISELKFNPQVCDKHIGTMVKNGIVSLTGTVPHYSEKNAAEEAVQRVCGVRGVANELEVKITEGFERSDEDILEAADRALAWCYSAPKDLKVSVNHGCITLKGKADWDYQRNAARDAVTSLMGVVSVNNQIQIKAQAQVSDVKDRIEKALQRSAENEAKAINVAVSGSRVTLTGEVHTLGEKDDARFAAWCTPGIDMVDNKLAVSA